MKTYIADDRIRMAGKGWEIRHRLKQMARESGARTQTVKQYIDKRRNAVASPARKPAAGKILQTVRASRPNG